MAQILREAQNAMVSKSCDPASFSSQIQAASTACKGAIANEVTYMYIHYHAAYRYCNNNNDNNNNTHNKCDDNINASVMMTSRVICSDFLS